MPLEEYTARRRPGATPEPMPRPGAGTPGGGHAFVVQWHAARRLHYDLRLERDGVLLSWAVPRGLPIACDARHLAVHVEDHPLDYAGFEGEIPAGQYGAGMVGIWDAGTYEEIRRHGEGLDFRLMGTRARGCWRLVAAAMDGEARNWLLTRIDPDAPEAGQRPVRRPMLATPALAPPGGPEWMHEVKWDGHRAIARLQGQEARITSRSGADVTERHAAVAAALADALRSPDCVLDGELVALDSDGNPSFQMLQGSTGTPAIYVFDMLEEAGRDMRALPWHERRARLEQVVQPGHAVVRVSAAFADGGALLRQVRRAGLEGVVSKRIGSPYSGGRRPGDWRKVPLRQHADRAVAGFRPVRGHREGVGSLVLAQRDDAGQWRWSGNCGSGISDADSRRLERALRPLAMPLPPDWAPSSLAGDDAITWVAPRLSARVRFTEATASGRLRHPVFEGLLPDDGAPGAGGPSRFRATRREKAMFPDEGITKGDLIDYYARVGPLMLPAVQGRPLTLIRYPDGITGKRFYQRNRPRGMPEWVPSARVPMGPGPDARTVDAPLIDSIDALLWFVNSGCIDVNAWIATVADPAHPDMLLFDLDAPEGSGLAACAEVALMLRPILERAGMRPGVRASSRDGMHVVAPLEQRIEWAEARAACRSIATALERDHPGVVTTEWAKHRRRGVLIDCNQVGWARSISAAWSVRPRAGAPVAVPLEWREVEHGVDPRELTMDAALERASA